MRLIVTLLFFVASLLPPAEPDPNDARETEAFIFRSRGWVTKDFRITGEPVTELKLVLDPKALQRLRLFPELRKLRCECCFFEDDQLDLIASHPRIEEVQILGSLITDEGIKKLQARRPTLKIDAGTRNTAAKRARKHFRIPDSEVVNSQTIKRAILRDLPLKSSEKAIVEYLTSCGLGKDGLSSIYPKQEGQIVCRIEYDVCSGEIVHEHYGIMFLLDEAGLLTDIQVKTWATGP